MKENVNTDTGIQTVSQMSSLEANFTVLVKLHA